MGFFDKKKPVAPVQTPATPQVYSPEIPQAPQQAIAKPIAQPQIPKKNEASLVEVGNTQDLEVYEEEETSEEIEPQQAPEIPEAPVENDVESSNQDEQMSNEQILDQVLQEFDARITKIESILFRRL